MPSRIDEIVSAIARLERELEQETHGAREQWRYRVDAGPGPLPGGRAGGASPPEEQHSALPAREQPAPHSDRAASLLVDHPDRDTGSLDQRVSVGLLPRVSRSHRPPLLGRHDRSAPPQLSESDREDESPLSQLRDRSLRVRPEIAGRTEQNWCPIKHATRVRGAHGHYHAFVDFGDADGYRRRLPLLRAELQDKEPAKTDHQRETGR